MNLNKDIIRGVVEEEIEEARFRKKVREKVKEVVGRRKEKKKASEVLPSIFKEVSRQMQEVPQDTDLRNEMLKIKEELRQLMIDYDAL